MTSPYTLSDFDFTLPPELIAQHPAAARSASRLLDGRAATPVDRVFTELPALLEPGDLLVVNDTRVIKARLLGAKASGGRVEALVERVLPGHLALCHLRASKPPRAGSVVVFEGPDGARLQAEVRGRGGADGSLFELRFPDEPLALLERFGHVPLPPYIAHADTADDARRYQSVFARQPGAVAAPTASLHFDDTVLAALAARGVQRASLTLHVGAGTFQPVRGDDLAAHRMHSEWFDVPAATVAAIGAARARGGRVVAVGTTTLRGLHSPLPLQPFHEALEPLQQRPAVEEPRLVGMHDRRQEPPPPLDDRLHLQRPRGPEPVDHLVRPVAQRVPWAVPAVAIQRRQVQPTT